MKVCLLPSLLAMAICAVAVAAPVTYEIDPKHTYPSFEADHEDGLSIWRGKFDRTSGTVVLDKAAGQGTVDIVVDMSSVDFGLEAMNRKARSDEMFDVAQFPQATYKGKLDGFANGAPSRVVGELTLHGVTKPLVLKIDSFKCMQDRLVKREVCGADALATFDRSDFGINTSKKYGFKMWVALRIQVQAIRARE